jgi:hypothetical protein
MYHQAQLHTRHVEVLVVFVLLQTASPATGSYSGSPNNKPNQNKDRPLLNIMLADSLHSDFIQFDRVLNYYV